MKNEKKERKERMGKIKKKAENRQWTNLTAKSLKSRWENDKWANPTATLCDFIRPNSVPHASISTRLGSISMDHDHLPSADLIWLTELPSS